MAKNNLIIDNRYHVTDFLGQGGMAKVYRATDLTLKRDVAVKVLPSSKENLEAYIQRFDREFRVCASLRHQNIITLYDCGSTNDGLSMYYTMELLDCPDLYEVIDDRGRLHPDLVESIVRQLISAFDCYHEKGIVHRDLKPSNIMLLEGKRAIITDFGLVYDPSRTAITKTGFVVGTPSYYAPELLQGKTVSRATDYFQLGVIVYQCLTGTVPFKGKNLLELSNAIETLTPVPVTTLVPELSDGWNTLLDYLLAKDPSLRPSHSQQVLEKLAFLHRKVPSGKTKPDKKLPAQKKSHQIQDASKSNTKQGPVAETSQSTLLPLYNKRLISIVVLILCGLVGAFAIRNAPPPSAVCTIPDGLKVTQLLPKSFSLEWASGQKPEFIELLGADNTVITKKTVVGSQCAFSHLSNETPYKIRFVNGEGGMSPAKTIVTPESRVTVKSLGPGEKADTAYVVFETSEPCKLRIQYSYPYSRDIEERTEFSTTHRFEYASDKGRFIDFSLFLRKDDGSEELLSLPKKSLRKELIGIIQQTNVPSAFDAALKKYKKLAKTGIRREDATALWENTLFDTVPGFKSFSAWYPFLGMLCKGSEQDVLDLKKNAMTLKNFEAVAIFFKFDYHYPVLSSMNGAYEFALRDQLIFPPGNSAGPFLTLFHMPLKNYVEGITKSMFADNTAYIAHAKNGSCQSERASFVVESPDPQNENNGKMKCTFNLFEDELKDKKTLTFRMSYNPQMLGKRYFLKVNAEDELLLSQARSSVRQRKEPRDTSSKPLYRTLWLRLPVRVFSPGENTLEIAMKTVIDAPKFSTTSLEQAGMGVQSVYLLLEDEK